MKKILLISFNNKKSTIGFAIILFFSLIAFIGPIIAPYNPQGMNFLPLQSPTFSHLLGTNSYGQDLFSRVLVGTRLSLIVAIVTGIITTTISMLIGLTAGYLGGLIDDILVTITNIFLVIPGLPLMIIIAAYITVKGIWPIIFVISFTGWAWGARVLRSQTLTLKNRDFVKASVITGEKPIRIVFFEIFPNMVGLVTANFFGTAIYAVLSEATLEFLGLGSPEVISWGTILYWAQNNQALMLGAWWWFLFPGLCIALLGTGFALMNFAVDELTNPRLRKR